MTVPETNTCTPSTRWVTKRVKVTPAPKAHARQSGEARPPLSERNPRDPLTVTMVYRGGPEGYWEVRARGRVWRFPGHVAVFDMMRVITACHSPR
jgi:hypothetical protein